LLSPTSRGNIGSPQWRNCHQRTVR